MSGATRLSIYHFRAEVNSHVIRISYISYKSKVFKNCISAIFNVSHFCYTRILCETSSQHLAPILPLAPPLAFALHQLAVSAHVMIFMANGECCQRKAHFQIQLLCGSFIAFYGLFKSIKFQHPIC